MLTRKSPVKLKAKLLEEGRAWEALQAQCWCGKLLSREPPQSLSYLWTQNPHSSTKQETLQEFEHPWVRIMLIINPRFSRNIPILNITSYQSEYVAPILSQHTHSLSGEKELSYHLSTEYPLEGREMEGWREGTFEHQPCDLGVLSSDFLKRPKYLTPFQTM